jgi:hypothetical protein
MSFVIKNTQNKETMRLNVLVYGDYKIGKTYLASMVKDALIISIEDGVLSLAGTDVDYIEVKSYTQVMQLIKAIKTEDQFKKYKWIFLDTITEFGQTLYPRIRDKYEEKAQSNGSKGADGRQVWGNFGEKIGDIVRAIRSLDKHTCILAHPTDKEQDDGTVKRSPDIYGKSGERIVGWLDEIFYMHMNDKGERMFLTQSTDRTIAGDRSGKLEKIEPALLDVVAKKMLGK